jgi:hypothetical protein
MADFQAPAGFQQVAAGTQAAAPTPNGAPAGFEEVGTDATPLPDHANGMSPLTPINASPLSIEERYKLGLGNEKGRDEYLKNKFEAVTKDQHGNILVKDQGLWHRMDPDNFGDADAWTITKGLVRTAGALGALVVSDKWATDIANKNPVSKELLSEYGENLPGMIAMGTSALAGMATGGASLGAQAAGAAAAAGATELTRTSLGRLEGTYVATPEEQVKDVALESVLNAVGVGIAAGVKPTAGWLAKQLEQKAPSIANIPQASRNIIKSMYGDISGVGSDNIDELLNNTSGVRSAMQSLGAKASGSNAKFVQAATLDSVDAVKNMAPVAKAMLSETYKNAEQNLVDVAGETFKSDLSGFTDQALKSATDNGLVVLAEPAANGKLVRKTAEGTAKLIAENNGVVPSKFSYMVPSRDELFQMFKNGNVGASDALVDETHQALSKVVVTMNSLRGGQANGEQAVKQLLKANQLVNDLTYQFRQEGVDSGVNSLNRLMSSLHKDVEDATTKKFGEAGAGAAEAFTKIKSNYSAMADALRPITDAAKKADGKAGEAAYEKLLSQLAAKPGKNATVKDSYDAVVAQARSLKLNGLADKFAEQQARIRANTAAVAFNPMISKGIVGKGSATAAIGSVAMGHPALAGALAVGAATTSPRLAYANTLGVKALTAGKDMLASQITKQGNRLVQNPAALNAFVSAISQAPSLSQKTQQHLLGGQGGPSGQ